MKKINTFLATLILLALTTQKANAHCEIPCGIYHDELRIEMLKEHIQTIRKSMEQIAELQEADQIDYNQLVRWIDNKELHANKMQEIVYQYFMNQRIKPVDSENEKYETYIKQLSLAHELLVYSMKAKQSIDLDVIDKLNETLNAFEDAYFEDKDHRHKMGEEKEKEEHKH
ncbi:MAG: superoxide dismutase, Ni [Bacteroidales bacterium]|nr:superoxide dismutase, Ni [Bacteroidales bacterium]MCF8345250.1 superoxide dismutase, Ni [Bacteroidales bacterium]MCF8352254.1 superoxide dismutase, Ni [Bacteroidales bacterium]MCF8376102.1 superoxide dismutase, Ni [Bacteroidales bacterium]MCF8401415.1 superoxide dismutase, Ni [Bacteroidales bacterium]